MCDQKHFKISEQRLCGHLYISIQEVIFTSFGSLAQGYLGLVLRGELFRVGIEPHSPVWKAEMLFTTLTRRVIDLVEILAPGDKCLLGLFKETSSLCFLLIVINIVLLSQNKKVLQEYNCVI